MDSVTGDIELRSKQELIQNFIEVPVIDCHVYTGTKPLPDPDIIELINRPLKLAERAPTREWVLSKVVEYVDTYINGIAA